MKKFVKFTAGVTVLALMFCLCACTDNKQTPAPVSVTVNEAATEASVQEGIAFSDSATGLICRLSVDVIGQDLETAKKYLGDFFGVELVDDTGFLLTEERGDITTHLHVYTVMLVKDDVRFNGVQIWTDEKDGHVRCIEYTLSNSSYTTVDIGDSPEVREEIKKLNAALFDELESSVNGHYNSDIWAYDEDSKYYDYNVDDMCLIRCGIRDFTEPGGNDLLSAELAFSDCKEYLPH